jgi:hypothetical protein
MKTILKSIYALMLCLAGLAMTACSDDNTSDMNFDGDARIESAVISGVEAIIDHSTKTLTANFPIGTDLSSLKVDAITLSAGATCDLPVGTTFNGTVPQAIKITNGDIYDTYTLTAAHDNIEFFSFTLNAKYSGAIDNSARTILVFVPINEDVTAMQASFTITNGATANPESGSLLDFTNPVEIVTSLRTATITYTVTVIKDEMSQEPKAFIGNVASMDQLGDEAKTACRWMLDNVPNSRYVSLQEIIDGTVLLDDFVMVWCHFDFTDWPSQMWDSRDQFNSYWLRGGAILASRDGARYINDVWRISRDQQCPNNMFGGDSYETLSYDLGFTITGHESHPLYNDIATDAEGRILLQSTGCQNSNRTLQWFVDWDPYGGMSGWEERTGAKALAAGHNYDPNCVTIAEFEPYEALKGFTSGRVLVIGTPAYQWYTPNGATNTYSDNMVQLTKNAINYLCQ